MDQKQYGIEFAQKTFKDQYMSERSFVNGNITSAELKEITSS